MSPTITKMEVWPVAGQDCMELNLSGAMHRILPGTWLSCMLIMAKQVWERFREDRKSQRPWKSVSLLWWAQRWLSIRARC